MEQRFKKQAQLGVPHSRIQVELGFILQAGTCQILNFAQNPRQSQSIQVTDLPSLKTLSALLAQIRSYPLKSIEDY